MKSNTHRMVSVQGLTWVVRHPRGLRYLIGPDIYVLVSQIDSLGWSCQGYATQTIVR